MRALRPLRAGIAILAIAGGFLGATVGVARISAAQTTERVIAPPVQAIAQEYTEIAAFSSDYIEADLEAPKILAGFNPSAPSKRHAQTKVWKPP